MSSIKVVLRKKALSNGSFPIFLRVTKNRRTKYYRTPLNTTLQEWNEDTGSFNGKNGGYIQKNRVLLKIKDRALKTYYDLELEKEDFSLEDFDKHFRVDTNPASQDVFRFWDEIIEEMRDAGRMGNAKLYHDASNSIKRFIGFKSLRFTEIDATFLNKYDAFLRSRGGTDGGIGVKMRTIRAMYNKALERNIFKVEKHPFHVYKISRLKGKGIKRALNLEQINKIHNVDLAKYPHLINYRNYFMFSFYSRGMNFADMIELKWGDIHGERIRYIRNKTKRPFSVKINPPLKAILDYYREHSLGTKYIFPILLYNDLTPLQLDHRKKKTLAQYNKGLKEIANLCGINQALSSYVARHSYANCLKQKGVATDIIGESLGHADIKITQVYLKELGNEIVDDAVEVLFN
ncbi:site-specific integrase [Sediminicola luteus]|nr:site-specific integrase [Sediminicola luteus]